MRRLSYISIVSICLLVFPVAVQAADAGLVATEASGFDFNPVLIGLVTLIFVLLFVIMIAANVIKQLAQTSRERLKQAKIAKNIAGLLVVFLAVTNSSTVFAQNADAAGSENTDALAGSISGMREDLFYLIVGLIALEFVVLFVQLLVIRTLIPVATGKEAIKKVIKAVKIPLLDRFNQSVAVEKETTILLDHDYDGIKELDNDLPPWWKYGFYLTIVVAVIYFGYYQLGGGPSSKDEYVAEVEAGEIAVAAYLEASASNVDENTVTEVTDASQLSAAQNTFQTVCAACHAKDGGGGVGPNLTDPYWLHGGSLKNIFSTIKYGWQDKGMKSWKDDYSPKEIAALASYVRSLQGTHPAVPKEKQGELYKETDKIADVAPAK